MKNSKHLLLALIFTLYSCKDDSTPEPLDALGANMVLMGNSFFKPYAENLDLVAGASGLTEHNASLIFRGGDNGRPINFWNDVDSPHRQEIKNELDKGNVDFFGMTAGRLPDNPTDGFSEWIAYALERNPELTVFLIHPPH